MDLSDNFDLNLEGYYKDFTQLVALNRNKTEANDPNYVAETGEAYGFDISGKIEWRESLSVGRLFAGLRQPQ